MIPTVSLVDVVGLASIAALVGFAVHAHSHGGSARYRTGVVLLTAGLVIAFALMLFSERVTAVLPRRILIAVAVTAFVFVNVGGYAYYTATVD